MEYIVFGVVVTGYLCQFLVIAIEYLKKDSFVENSDDVTIEEIINWQQPMQTATGNYQNYIQRLSDAFLNLQQQQHGVKVNWKQQGF